MVLLLLLVNMKLVELLLDASETQNTDERNLVQLFFHDVDTSVKIMIDREAVNQ